MDGEHDGELHVGCLLHYLSISTDQGAELDYLVLVTIPPKIVVKKFFHHQYRTIIFTQSGADRLCDALQP